MSFRCECATEAHSPRYQRRLSSIQSKKSLNINYTQNLYATSALTAIESALEQPQSNILFPRTSVLREVIDKTRRKAHHSGIMKRLRVTMAAVAHDKLAQWRWCITSARNLWSLRLEEEGGELLAEGRGIVGGKRKLKVENKLLE